MRLRVLTVTLLFLIASALAQDPALDLPTQHPGDYVASAPVTVPVPPIPPPTTERDDPVDEPPPVFYGEEIDTTSSLVYVLDRSGSMGGAKWDSVVRESCRSIEGLSEALRFDVVSFNCDSTAVWQELRRATPANKAEACAWILTLRPGSGTGTAPAVVVGLSLGPDALILLTDGEPSCNPNYGWVPSRWGGRPVRDYDTTPVLEQHRKMIRDNNRQGVPINVFGVEAGGECRRFCQNVASDNFGSYYDVR